MRLRFGNARWVFWLQGRPWGWGSYHSDFGFDIWVYGPVNVQRWSLR
jgi:hypothetical protein